MVYAFRWDLLWVVAEIRVALCHEIVESGPVFTEQVGCCELMAQVKYFVSSVQF